MLKSQKMDQLYEQMYQSAHQAGMAAVEAAFIAPMVVGTAKSVFGNEIDHTKPIYFVADGPCGFAWVTIKPANSSFAKWLKKEEYARNAYGGGVDIWVSDFNQSMQKKEAYAHAFALNLRINYGINAYAGSRMD